MVPTTQAPKKRKAIEEFVEESANESEDEEPKKRKKKKQQKKLKKIEDFEDEDDSDLEDQNQEAGKFVKPPPIDDNDDIDMQDVIDGWNGMGVPEPILKALAEKGFKSPTEIQSLSLPAAILGKKDILGAAETGSGKTLAFGIPILAGIMELKRKNITSGIRRPKNIPIKKSRDDRDNLTPPPEELIEVPMDDDSDVEEPEEEDKKDEEYKPLYAVVLTPTRELAVQVRDHIIAAAKYTGITAVAVFGGLAQQKQERILKRCPEIVVATPGRFWELLQQENSHLSKIDDISFLVIDETDRMVEKGHFEELKLLMKRINFDESRKQCRQNFIFSATLSMVHDLPDHLQKKNKKNRMAKITPGMKIQSLIEDLGISQPKIVDVTRSTRKFLFLKF